MKLIALIVIQIYSNTLSAQVWDLGYGTRVEKLLYADSNFFLVSGNNSYGPRTAKYLARFDKSLTGYNLTSVAYIHDTILDFRMVDNKLLVLGNLHQACDYYPDITFIKIFDLDSLSPIKYYSDVSNGTSSFLTDSTLVKYQSSPFIPVTTDLAFNVIDTVGYSGDAPSLVRSDKDLKLSFISSSYFGLYLLIHDKLINYDWNHSNPFHHLNFAGYTVKDEIKDAAFFGQDSICFITKDSIYVTDTSLTNYTSFSLPAHDRIQLSGNSYFAITGTQVDQFQVINNLWRKSFQISINQPRYKLAQLNISGNDSLFVLHSTSSWHNREILPVNTTIPKFQNAIDVQIDSLVVLSTLKVGTMSTPGYWSHAEVFFSNQGADSITEVLLNHPHKTYPGTYPCSRRYEKSLNIPLGPGDSHSELVNLYHYDINGALCVILSVPNHEVEDHIANNKACAYPILKLSETSMEIPNIYPNPVSQNLMWINNLDYHTGTYRIVSLMGEIVRAGSYTDHAIEVNLHKLSKGIYLVEVMGDNGTVGCTRFIRK